MGTYGRSNESKGRNSMVHDDCHDSHISGHWDLGCRWGTCHFQQDLLLFAAEIRCRWSLATGLQGWVVRNCFVVEVVGWNFETHIKRSELLRTSQQIPPKAPGTSWAEWPTCGIDCCHSGGEGHGKGALQYFNFREVMERCGKGRWKRLHVYTVDIYIAII